MPAVVIGLQSGRRIRQAHPRRAFRARVRALCIRSTIEHSEDAFVGPFGLPVDVENGGFQLRERERPVCHGYANGCTCPDCQDRADDDAKHDVDDGLPKPAPEPPTQPWVPQPPRHRGAA